MQTNLLQSQLCRNAALITALIADMLTFKQYRREALDPAASSDYHKDVRKTRTQIVKMAAIQKAIKFDLLACKLARLRETGHHRTKHGKDDPRYEAWAVGYAGAQ